MVKSTYHQSKVDYRNIAIPKAIHKRLCHIAIDQEISVSEIVTMLAEKFCANIDAQESGVTE